MCLSHYFKWTNKGYLNLSGLIYNIINTNRHNSHKERSLGSLITFRSVTDPETKKFRKC